LTLAAHHPSGNPTMNPDESGNRIETDNQTYIRLLTALAQATAPITTDERDTLSDIVRLSELEMGGYINGEVVRDEVGGAVCIGTMTITVQGRRFLDELKKA